ncbi:helix-turn-helix transcriptional regulator [Trinickia dinghuensis]|uniref:LuxR family transcriptional regulator n=1 Tax=Trinickia dinghuensis TaxID=2291023 RepID=A0A3D8JY76_9BURK|nr:LuxR family transcriptional regulator [Trinickia dinghuensis]RDU98078.1 LuxR family transcriptional regulator [Trinickia dinghuensis]
MSQYGPLDADTDASNFLIYGDADLDSMTDTPLDDDAPEGQRLAGIAHDLAKVGTAQARHALLRPALRAAGFESLCYMRVSRIGDTINRIVYFNAFSPTGWAQRYLRERFHEIDARLAYSCRHEWPMLWDLSSIASHEPPAGTAQSAAGPTSATAARAERFATAARDAGMLSGVSFGLGTPDALDTCVVMFSNSQPSKARLPDMSIGHAYALAVGLHEFLALREPQIHRPAHIDELSGIQRSILELVTLGLNDKDIAERLGTSHHNVDYYLRQLKKLYHATNRVQLAYIAGRVLTQ